MSRKVLFRHLLALRFLAAGDFSAYWFALPARAKAIRSPRDLMWHTMHHAIQKRIAKSLFDDYADASRVASAIRNGEAVTLSPYVYRLPLTITGHCA